MTHDSNNTFKFNVVFCSVSDYFLMRHLLVIEEATQVKLCLYFESEFLPYRLTDISVMK